MYIKQTYLLIFLFERYVRQSFLVYKNALIFRYMFLKIRFTIIIVHLGLRKSKIIFFIFSETPCLLLYCLKQLPHGEMLTTLQRSA